MTAPDPLQSATENESLAHPKALKHLDTSSKHSFNRSTVIKGNSHDCFQKSPHRIRRNLYKCSSNPLSENPQRKA